MDVLLHVQLTKPDHIMDRLTPEFVLSQYQEKEAKALQRTFGPPSQAEDLGIPCGCGIGVVFGTKEELLHPPNDFSVVVTHRAASAGLSLAYIEAFEAGFDERVDLLTVSDGFKDGQNAYRLLRQHGLTISWKQIGKLFAEKHRPY